MSQMNEMISKIALMIVPVLLAITVHEVCHGYAAFLLGDPTAKKSGRLTMNPVKHIDPVGLLVLFITGIMGMAIGWAKPVPVDPRYFKKPRLDMMWVSLAGPASNFALAVLTTILIRLFTPVLVGTIFYPLVEMAQFLVMINVGLAVFNLIPIHPLDGSHILEGLLPLRMAYSYSRLQPYGFMILLALIFTGVVNIIVYPIIIVILNLLNLLMM
jgi:Zn-dependent protease